MRDLDPGGPKPYVSGSTTLEGTKKKCQSLQLKVVCVQNLSKHLFLPGFVSSKNNY
jgi:hypothetical protein